MTVGWAALAFLAGAVLGTITVYSYRADEIDPSFLLPQGADDRPSILYTRVRMRPVRPIIEAQWDIAAR